MRRVERMGGEGNNLSPLKFKDLEVGRIYLSANDLRVVRFIDDKGNEFLYCLATGHFIKVDDGEVGPFYEYKWGLPLQSLLDEEFINGGEAVRKQIKSGEVIRVRRKTKRGIYNYVRRQYKKRQKVSLTNRRR